MYVFMYVSTYLPTYLKLYSLQKQILSQTLTCKIFVSDQQLQKVVGGEVLKGKSQTFSNSFSTSREALKHKWPSRLILQWAEMPRAFRPLR